MIKILFMGPLAPPYTGQSVAFTTVVNHLKNEKSVIINISNKDTIITGIGLCLKINFLMIFKSFDRIYFTCSRSFAGSIRDLILLFWARIRNIPVVNHLHGCDFKLFYDSMPHWYRKIIHWCYENVETSIVLTEGMKSQFSDFPQMKVEVVTNSYSADLDQCPVIKMKKNDKKVNVVYMSNIMQLKGILILLESFKQILEKYNNIVLYIAGMPVKDMQSSATEISRKFNELYERLHTLYPDQIHYLGVCSGEKKKKLLWESDIFVLPTFYPTEAFPISILEGLRTGNYILTTNHRYIPEAVSRSNGNLIRPNSVEDLTNALEEIILLPEEQLHEIQNNNIRYAIEKFGEDQYIQGVKKLISDVNI